MAEIFMTSEPKKNKKKKLVNMWKFVTGLIPFVVKSLLFKQAWGGCHTTFGIFNQGKTTVMKMVDNKNSNVLKVCEVFNSIDVTPNSVTETGLKIFILSYGKYFDLN